MLRKCGPTLKVDNVKQTVNYRATKREFTLALRVVVKPLTGMPVGPEIETPNNMGVQENG